MLKQTSYFHPRGQPRSLETHFLRGLPVERPPLVEPPAPTRCSGKRLGRGAVQGPHSPWGRFLLREQPREGTRGLPLLPAPLQGTGSVCALEGAQIPALFSSARQDTPRPPSPLPCPPPPSSGQPGLSHPGTRGRAYRSRGGARTRLAHPPRSPAVAVTTAPEEESGLCSNNVCVPAALPTV